MKKSIRYVTLLAMLIMVVGCASSTRNEVDMSSKDGIGISSNSGGTELYGSVRMGVTGHL